MAKLTYEYVKGYIDSFGYKLLSGEYKNSREKLLIECPNGHKWEVSYASFQQGTRCPYCKKELFTYEDVKAYIEALGYELLSKEYKGTRDKILVKCPKGHEYKVKFNSFKGSKNRKGTRCPYCYGRIKLSYEYVEKNIKNEGYELLTKEYVNAHQKLLIRCNKGHEFSMQYNSFQQGQRCPMCNISKGEKRIMDWLNKHRIEYIYEKKFDNLLGIGNKQLSYDFYLPKQNLLIEYQGEFHDGTITGSYKNTFDFNRQQEHDERKRTYAEVQNIKLLEIWYWDFDNIEKILNDEINK